MNQLEQMIDTYQNLIFSICYKLTGNYFDSQDLTQDTFLAAYKNLSNFDGKNEKAWLSRIATNKSLDYLKRAARRTSPQEDTFFEEFSSKEQTPEALYMEKDVKKQLMELCGQLSPPYDEIARLYFGEELTVQEMAPILDRNEKTIWTQIYRAKAMLKKKYEKEGTLCRT